MSDDKICTCPPPTDEDEDDDDDDDDDGAGPLVTPAAPAEKKASFTRQDVMHCQKKTAGNSAPGFAWRQADRDSGYWPCSSDVAKFGISPTI